jgi:hypothetical protein
MPRLTKLELLQYALDGARTRRGLLCNFPADQQEADELEADELEADAKEIERRIKLTLIAQQLKEQAP